MKYPKIAAVLLAMIFANPTAYGVDDEAFDLVLIPADLDDAKKTLTVYDPNEDGRIDKDEQKRLPWKERVADYDLNRDGRLTHLELAVRFAKLRDESGVIQIDRNIAMKYVRLHDSNGNGQLDADEIANGWPVGPEEFDKNNDGVLTTTEIAATFALRRQVRAELGIAGVDQGGAIKTVNRFDADKDGYLNQEEWEQASLPLDAKKFDHEEDGRLSVMDVANMLAHHRRALGLSKDDQLELRNIFRRLDQNGDGEVLAEEFAIMRQTLSSPPEWETLNKNGDEKLTVSELELVFAQQRKKKGYMDAEAQAAARLMLRHDRDRSGFVEASELIDGQAAGQLSKPMLKQIDLNGDQRLSKEEIAKHLAKSAP